MPVVIHGVDLGKNSCSVVGLLTPRAATREDSKVDGTPIPKSRRSRNPYDIVEFTTVEPAKRTNSLHKRVFQKNYDTLIYPSIFRHLRAGF